jgi:hypothetical protein
VKQLQSSGLMDKAGNIVSDTSASITGVVKGAVGAAGSVVSP